MVLLRLNQSGSNFFWEYDDERTRKLMTGCEEGHISAERSVETYGLVMEFDTSCGFLERLNHRGSNILWEYVKTSSIEPRSVCE